VSFPSAEYDFTGDDCDPLHGRYVRVQLKERFFPRILSLAEVQVYGGGSIAKWNRATRAWSPLGRGVEGVVHAIALSGDDVYVGGDFTAAGGGSANRIARWDQTTHTWSPLASGADGTVYAIAVGGEDVYVGGDFTTASGGTVNNVARWNRAIESWSGLGGGITGTVHALAINVIGDVYAGGEFVAAGGVSAANVARWTGTAWELLGSGLADGAHAIAVDGSQVYVGSGYLVGWNDLLDRWAWPDQTWFTLAREEEAHITRTLTADSTAHTQRVSIDSAQRSQFNDSGCADSWDWEARRENVQPLGAGQAPWHTAVAPLPCGDGYRVAALVGDAPPPGYALRFDGVDDHVNVGDQIDLTDASFTVAFWAKRDAINDYDFIVGQGPENPNQGLHIGFRNNNAFTCGFFYDDLDTPPLSDIDWHHWACTYDASDNLRTIYRDGILVAQDTAAGDYQGSGDLYIGRTSWGSLADHFGGLIDEVRIWNVARTQAEIQMDMHRALTGDEPGLVGYWQFDEGVGDTVYDQTGDGNDGTLLPSENGPTWDTPNAPLLTNGGIAVYTVDEDGFSSTPITVDDGFYAKHAAPPGVACAEDGTCLALWSEQHDDSFDVYGAIVAPDLSAGTPFAITSGADSVRPAVASDGTDFLAAWERLVGDGQIWTRRVDVTGTLGVELRLDDKRADDGQDDLGVDLAWAGDRTIAVWENLPSSGDPDVWTAYVNGDGTYEPGSAQAVAATSGREEQPQVAYNPDTGKAMVVYRSNGDGVRGRVVQGDSASNALDVGSRGTDDALFYPRLAYDPIHASWVTAWSATTGDGRSAVNFQALRVDGPGPALSFDGLDDYVNVGNQINLVNASFTIAFWARRNGMDGNQYIIGQGPDWSDCGLHIGFRNNNMFTCAFYDNDLDVSVSTDTDWHHWACTYDASTSHRTIYRDGIQVAQDEAWPGYQGTGDLYIGRGYENCDGVAGCHFDGIVDEVRVWSVARTQGQIQADMHQTLSGSEPGLVGYWRFDEGSGSTAHDQTPNGNDGTLVPSENGPEWTADAPFPSGIYATGPRQQYTWSSELSSPGSSLACTQPLGPRMLWLRFDESAGATTFADNSGHDNAGSCSGDSCPDAGDVGQVGAGLRFDGVDDYVDLPDALDDVTDFTFAAWVYWQGGGAWQRIFDFGQDTSYNMFLTPSTPDNMLRFAITTGGAFTEERLNTGSLPTNQWVHIAVTLEGDIGTLFVNGIAVDSQPITLNPADVVGEYTWLGRSQYVDPYFGGLLDDVVIFRSALSARQIAALYDGSYDAACALTTNDVPWAGDLYRNLYYNRLNLRWPLPWMGTIESPQPAVITVTIDADPPTTSTITSLGDGDYVRCAVEQIPTYTLIIGGEAEDAVSGVGYVEVQVDDGEWQPATGAETWAYEWQIGAMSTITGEHAIRTRAVDNVGNVFTETLGIRVFVDVDWPEVDIPIESGTIVTATRDAQGHWTVPLHGTAEDAIYYGVTTPPGSGVRSVEVLLEGSAGVAGRAWQTATLTRTVDTWNWNIDYVLPSFNNENETMVDPTGEYTFLTRATDEVGNRTPEPFYLGVPIRIDNTAPIAVITDTGSATALITRPLDIRGVITDPGTVAKGVGDLEIAYTPAHVAHALSRVALLLHLDEAAGATTFDDAGGNNAGSCAGDSCPQAGVSGRSGTALEFDGLDDYVDLPDNFPNVIDFTFAAWVYWQGGDVWQRIFDFGRNTSYNMYLTPSSSDNTLRFAITTEGAEKEQRLNTGSLPMNQWVHIAVVLDGVTGTLYVNGSAMDSQTIILNPADVVGENTWLGRSQYSWDPYFNGLLDDVVIFRSALSDTEVETLYDSAAQSWLDWQAATLSSPGGTHSTWSHTVPGSVDGHDPDGLEGLVQIDLRGTDELDNRNDRHADWGAWQGEIDTLAPRVGVEYEHWGTDETARTVYRCWAEDLNLDIVECPCPILPSDRHTYDAPWWRTWFSDTTRLYRVQTACVVKGHRPASEAVVQARDRFDHLSAYSPTMAPQAVLARTPPVDSAIFTPTYGTLLITTAPISVEGGAWVRYGLEELTVTVDGAPIYTSTWPAHPQGTNWATTYTPTAEGPHTLKSVAVDQFGTVQTQTHPITVTLDTQAPVIRVPAAVLTSAHRLSYGRVVLTGPYTEAGGVDAIRVQTDGGDWFGAAALDQVWRYAWDLGEEPDGETYTVTAVITDVAGGSAQHTNTVLVDLVPPAAVTVTMAYTDSDGVYTTITPWETVRDVISPTLVITWTASESADLSFYYAGWTSERLEQIGNLSTYTPTRRHEQGAGEAQALYAHVVAQDVRGNQRWHTLGPIYTDVISTPDYILFPTPSGGEGVYHGWTASGGSQIGADRELERNAQDGQAVTGIQRFYVTWDADALRLAWTGADWNNDGDLFFYFDTQPGGSSIVYDPYTTTNTLIQLPAQGGDQLEADYLIWVEDSATAELRYWSGSDWAISATLSSDHYKSDTTLALPVTDLIISFDLLSISDPATAALKLVAVASEEETLRLWAAMPEKNPLNSERVLNTPGGPLVSHEFALTQQYEWTSLGLGLVPNAGQFTDADLLVDITADPPGVEVGYLEHDLLYLTPGTPLDVDLDGEPDMDLPLDTDPGLVGQGQVITYTVRYANEGTEVAPGVRVTITARGALQLSSNPLVLDLGDVGAGFTATRQFTGTVDTSVYTQSVEVDAVVADATHGPFDWLWIQHDVDTAAPEDVEIVAPRRYIKPFTNTVRGTVYDPSGVPTITLAAQPLQAGTPFTTTCIDGTPDDGQWVCAWDIGAANNRDQFWLRPLATDRFGNGPTVGDWVTLTVDAFPPTITLDADAELALQGALLGPQDTLVLSGEVQDDQQAEGAEICFAQAYGQTCEDISVYPGDVVTGTWGYALRAVGELDNERKTLSLYGVDGAGNRSAPLTRTYGVDTVPPVITVILWVDYLPAPSPMPVLGGTVSDGGGVNEMYVSVETPEGGTSWDPVAPVGEAWSYTLNPQTEGVHTLWIQARDPKGNTSEEGPYRVLVGIKEVYLPLVLRNH
jgi:hypothetical protein